MSVQSQEKNMRKLAELLSHDLGYIWGERESGPNEDKKEFLKTGKTFLWNLSKDLKLRDAKVSVNPGGIAVSGECSLIGLWNDSSGGIYIQLSQSSFDRENVLLYRSVQSISDYTGGQNNFVTLNVLQRAYYPWLLDTLSAVRKERARYGWAA